MKARWSLAELAVAMTLLSGCDARAGSDYEGDSLLSIEGSVAVADPTAPKELVPAIAFRDPKETLHLLDVAVRGEFPANFRLDVLDRPPAEAFYDPSRFFPGVTPADPRFALAYIAAVAPDHPERIALASKSYAFHCDGPAMNAPPTGMPLDPNSPGVTSTPGNACFRETEACTYVGTACYRKVERCDTRYENCEVIELSGDPELLKTNSADHFAGLSSDYLLVYLERAAARGTAVARMFGAGQTLPAGYHLVQVRRFSEAEREEYSACWKRAEAIAYERFNAAHGSDYSPSSPPEFATSPNIFEMMGAASIELDCAVMEYELTPVDRLRRRKISIVVGASEAPPYLFIDSR